MIITATEMQNISNVYPNHTSKRNFIIYLHPKKLASLMFENINVIYFPEVLEYQPGPPEQWVEVGNLQERRGFSAVLSIGNGQLPCF